MINFKDLEHLRYDNPSCRDHSKDVFFPVRGHGDHRPYRRAVEYAQTICSTCPEQIRCYRDAKQRHEQHGIWGGINFSDRRRPGEQSQDVDSDLCGTEAGWRHHAQQIKHGGVITCQPCLNARAAARDAQ